MFEWLGQRLRAAAELTDAWQGINLVTEFRPPAPAEAIVRCEAELTRALPESFREFLKLHDGGFVGAEVSLTTTTSTTGFQVYGAAECAAATRRLPEVLEPFGLPTAAFDGLVVFAEYGNSDICLFDASGSDGKEYPVIDGFHEAPSAWREAVIAPNFEEWLRQIFSAMIDRRQYPQYWIPSPLRPL